MRPPAAAALLLAALPLLAADGGAQAPPELDGRLVLDPDSTTLAGRTVVLHRVTADTGMAVDSAVTGRDGHFTFPLRGASGDVFVVSARHAGILYFGPAVEGGSPAADYRLAVYDVRAAGPADTLTLSSRALVVTASPDGIDVTDVIEVRGAPDRTLVGRVPVPAEGRREAWWRLRLPRGARNPRVLAGGVGARQAELAGGEARLSAPVPPTGARVVLGYTVPRDGEIRLRTLHPTDHLEVVVREDAAGIGVEGLPGPEELSTGGARYRRYADRGVEAGRSVRVTVAGTGGSGRSGGSSLPRAAWIAGILGLLLAGAAAVSWWTGRAGEER